jgi:hypothetical protein
MMKKLIRGIKQILCKHNYEYKYDRLKGVTIAWDGDPITTWDMYYICSKCSKNYIKTGMMYPRDIENKVNKRYYKNGENTFPVDPATGKNLKMAL